MSKANSQRLILASASPRRRQLLAELGAQIEVRPVDIDESPNPGEAAKPYVERLALAKARAAAENATSTDIVLAADTVVAIDGRLLGKPRDDSDAASMLEQLSGRQHQVMTGVAVIAGDVELHEVETTAVTFAPLTRREIDAYIATGEPADKAGAYAVQGRAALFVERLDGTYSNVVGLPLATVYRLLRQVGVDLLT